MSAVNEKIITAIALCMQAGQTTADGKPQVFALSEKLGEETTAAQRDEWFEAYSAMTIDVIADSEEDVSKPSEEKETTLPVEVLAERAGLADWQFAGIKHHYRWGAGKQMTEAQFARLVKTALALPASRF